MSTQICPNCGCHLHRYDYFAFGNVAIAENGTILFEGHEMRLPRSQHLITEALIRAQGRGLTRAVLANVLDGDIYDVTIAKYIERIRASFREVQSDFRQIRALRGFGAYRWHHRYSAGEPDAAAG